MSEHIPVFIYTFLACLSFCVIFKFHKIPHMIAAAAGGMLSWVIYVACGFLGNDLAQYLISTIIVSAYAEVMARVFKAPVTGFLTIGILPRHLSRVAAFVDDLKHQMPQASVRYALTEDLNEPFDVLLNASPVGMYPNSTDCPVSDALIDQADYFFDVIYNPTQTVLLRKAQAQGKVVMGGAAMLVLQAVRAHEIWNGDSYTPEQIASIIQEMEAKIDAQNAAK